MSLKTILIFGIISLLILIAILAYLLYKLFTRKRNRAKKTSQGEAQKKPKEFQMQSSESGKAVGMASTGFSVDDKTVKLSMANDSNSTIKDRPNELKVNPKIDPMKVKRIPNVVKTMK